MFFLFCFVFPNKLSNKRKPDILDDKWDVAQAALWFQRRLFIRACHWGEPRLYGQALDIPTQYWKLLNLRNTELRGPDDTPWANQGPRPLSHLGTVLCASEVFLDPEKLFPFSSTCSDRSLLNDCSSVWLFFFHTHLSPNFSFFKKF